MTSPRLSAATASDPSARAPALAGGSCSGFRPTGLLEGATGLPVGLHKSSALLSIALEFSVSFFDTRGQLLFKPRQLGGDLGVFARDDLRGEDARVGGAGLADRHSRYGNARRHLHRGQ